MFKFLLLYWTIRLLIALFRWFSEQGETSAEPESAPDPRWSDPKALFELYARRFPFLEGPEGAAFLRALLKPLVGNHLLLSRLDKVSAFDSPLDHTLEAVFYWLPRQGLRPLAAWKPRQHFETYEAYIIALIRYLFEQHPVPPVVERLWWYSREAELPVATVPEHPAEVLELYFYLTHGGGLRQAPFLRWDLSRAAVRYFYEAPGRFDLRQGYWYAQFRAEGAPMEVLEHLHCWPTGFSNTAFWRELVRLWLKSGPSQTETAYLLGFAIRQIEWLKFGVPHEAFLENEYLATRYGSAPELSLRGRSWPSLLRYLEDVVGLREFPLPTGMRERYTLNGPEGEAYLLMSIACPYALVMEGEIMAHCVGNTDYVEMARSGANSFWSLRLPGPNGRQKRLLTVRLYQGELSEAYGLANREATAEEWALLEAWVAECRAIGRQVVA